MPTNWKKGPVAKPTIRVVAEARPKPPAKQRNRLLVAEQTASALWLAAPKPFNTSIFLKGGRVFSLSLVLCRFFFFKSPLEGMHKFMVHRTKNQYKKPRKNRGNKRVGNVQCMAQPMQKIVFNGVV